MRRFGKWIFNAAAVGSLVLLACTVAFWVRGYWKYDRAIYKSGPAPAYGTQRFVQWDVESSCGGVSIGRQYSLSKSWMYTLFHTDDGGFEFGSDVEPKYPAAASFSRGSDHWSDPEMVAKSVWVVFPIWCPAAAFSILPGWWLVIRWLRRRNVAGLACAKCGYSLTGNVGGICPECGTAVAIAEKAPSP